MYNESDDCRLIAAVPGYDTPGRILRCALVVDKVTVDLRGCRSLGRREPLGLPFFIVTHRPEEEPEGKGFTFVAGVPEAVVSAKQAAGDKDAQIMGAADKIRQALDAGLIDELTIIIAPVVLGGGKRLFEGFSRSLELEHIGLRQSPHATFIDYSVKRS